MAKDNKDKKSQKADIMMCQLKWKMLVRQNENLNRILSQLRGAGTKHYLNIF